MEEVEKIKTPTINNNAEDEKLLSMWEDLKVWDDYQIFQLNEETFVLRNKRTGETILLN
jgi:hypothetical protein